MGNIFVLGLGFRTALHTLARVRHLTGEGAIGRLSARMEIILNFLTSGKLVALEHFGYVLALAATGAALTWVGSSSGPVDLFGEQAALFIVPSLTAVLAGLYTLLKKDAAE